MPTPQNKDQKVSNQSTAQNELREQQRPTGRSDQQSERSQNDRSGSIKNEPQSERKSSY